MTPPQPPADVTGLELLDQLFPAESAVLPWARDAVSAYFSGTTFSGRRFERLAAGDPNHFDATDLVAVSMLGVQVDGDAAIELLEKRSTTLNEMLALVPPTPIHDVKWSVLRPGSPADTLWHGLNDIPGLGPTLVGKLMARKRPHLIPVFDERVYRRMESPGGWWKFHWTWWDSDEHVSRVADLRAAVGGLEDISLLRIWDVVVWSYDRSLVPQRH